MVNKLKTRSELAALCEELKKKGKRVAYTSGVFDILHPGHVEYLEAARAVGDCLIVGLNSNTSVRTIKGNLRPIISEQDRAAVLAGLSAVDYIFIFDESNNNINVTTLKPDFYVKAGDYSKDKLSSAKLVEEYGGTVKLIPFKGGHSSSAIIDRIAGRYLNTVAPGSITNVPTEKSPAIFLDRDGTIIEFVEYLFEPAKVKILPNALLAIKALKEAGFKIIVTTNQPGISLGYFTVEDFFVVNRVLLKAISATGVSVDKVYFCPHHSGENCKCHKPNTAMIERAVKELNVDLARSFVVGDSTRDIQLGKNAGCKTVLVKTGFAGGDGHYKVEPDFIAEDLAQAADYILGK